MSRLIVSVYDRSGSWAAPYARNGYQVLLWDKSFEGCILQWFGSLCERIRRFGLPLYGLLAAPPCTYLCRAGARWRKIKDRLPSEYDGWTLLDIARAQVSIVLHLVELFSPHFWVLENPIGRVEKVVPEIKPFRRMEFDPCDYGDPYTKHTILYGQFNTALPQQPTLFALDYIHKLPPSLDRAAKRSVTPKGFASAFFAANP
ncbi:MAG TPA: hypothetical protein VN578_02490 [Candidatus Binatia bacterium]|jgi:hypothetical protein|nr:hypothetical protein [Candidatus Binatia bacterium]